MFVVSSRDFVIVNYNHLHPDGSISIMVYSDEKYGENMVPKKKDATRGFIHVGGWHLEKVSEKETRATLILELDLKGYLSQSVLRNTNVLQGNQLLKLPGSIERFKAENPH